MARAMGSLAQRRAILGLAMACLVMAGCESKEARQQREDVIAWASENGYAIDEYVVGMTNKNLDEAEWEARGKALPNAEAILLELAADDSEPLDPALIAIGLRAVGTEKCLPVLIAIANGDDEWASLSAIYTLRRFPESEEVLTALGRRLLMCSANQRQMAVATLEAMGTRDSREMLEAIATGLRSELEFVESALDRMDDESVPAPAVDKPSADQ